MSPKGVLSLLLSPQYEYQYEVKDPEQNLFFDKNEIGDETGKVTNPSLLKKIIAFQSASLPFHRQLKIMLLCELPPKSSNYIIDRTFRP